MNKTFYFSIALSSFLMISGNAYAETWASITGHGITKDQNLVDVSIDTEGTIPTDGSQGAIGYGVITGVNDDGYPENVLALTSHKCVADSLVQGPAGTECDNTVGLLNALFGISDEDHNDATWHAHFLDLMPITEASDCATVENHIELEVDLARTLATKNNVSPNNMVNVVNPPENKENSNISVSALELGDFHNSAFKKIEVKSFGIVGFANEEGTVTHLCLTNPPSE